MHESGSSGSGDYSDNSFDQYSTDFELWEAELGENENIARLSLELGRFSLQESMASDNSKVPEYDEEPELEQPQMPEQWQQPKPERQQASGESYLLSDDMFDVAMGLIYLTTGVPADEMYR